MALAKSRLLWAFAPFTQFLYYRLTLTQNQLSKAYKPVTPYQSMQVMRTHIRSFMAVVSAVFLFSACGGGSGSDTPAATSEPAADAETTLLGTASVSGSVAFVGTAPARPRIRQDRECSELNDGPVLGEAVVVNDNGTLQNVFVYVKEGLGEYTFAVPSEPVVFDQTGCTYAPHIFGIQVGQTLKILNSDPLMHNIHALAESNRPFNMGMPNQGDERDRSFRVPEVMLKIKCDVHPWMGAYAGVVDHPFHSVSGEDGSFSFGQLPAGEYLIEAWHEEFGTATQTVTVAEGESVSIEFSFGG